ncbi:hypothetical protein GCM10022219_20670 [Microbacterium oryzae]|nr:plasmid mobilization relaxosome protein MobC [Microbacterium oryzae]
MNDEVVNMGRPTREGNGTPVEEPSRPHPSPSAGEGSVVEERSDEATPASKLVPVRMRRDELAALDEVQRHLGVNQSDALRRSVLLVAAALAATPSADPAERTLARRLAKKLTPRQPPVVSDKALLADIRDRLAEVAHRYQQQAFQLQKIGNNWNQIVKVLHALKNTRGMFAGMLAPLESAIHGVDRALIDLESRMTRDAERDAEISEKLERLF